jgi:hypothetical protein
MPLEDAVRAFEELRAIGYFFTMAPSAHELGESYPLRMAIKPPTPEPSSALSCGPFPVKREVYERMRRELPDVETLRVVLGFARLAFEKTGVLEDRYEVSAPEDAMLEFLASMHHWEVEEPHVTQDYVWIAPKLSLKQLVEEVQGCKYGPADYSWWEVRYDIQQDIVPASISDHPENLIYLPAEFHKWHRYLPARLILALPYLYSLLSTRGRLRSVAGLDALLSLIETAVEKTSRGEHREQSASTIDRELLIKELLDTNGVPYPIDKTTTFDFLVATGFIRIKRRKRTVAYSLARSVPDPLKRLRMPANWNMRTEKFLTTGSILFAYLTVDEVVSSR